MAIKTNAMRKLDTEKVKYTLHEYDTKGALDAVSVASQLDEDVNCVFKTLVTVSDKKNYYVFCIPGNKELDLKKCARVVGEKSIAMIHQKELLPLTGYIHGGCSPVGMKKLFPTYIHSSCEEFETIYVSAGKVGYQIQLDPRDLIQVIHGKIEDLIRDE